MMQDCEFIEQRITQHGHYVGVRGNAQWSKSSPDIAASLYQSAHTVIVKMELSSHTATLKTFLLSCGRRLEFYIRI